MRLTVLQQQTKALEEKQPEEAAAVSKQSRMPRRGTQK